MNTKEMAIVAIYKAYELENDRREVMELPILEIPEFLVRHVSAILEALP